MPPAKRPVRIYHTVVEDGVVYVNTPDREDVADEPTPADTADAQTFQGGRA
jgi:hypothetical protein